MGKNEPHRAEDARADASDEANSSLTSAFDAIERAADQRKLRELLQAAQEAHNQAADDKGDDG